MRGDAACVGRKATCIRLSIIDEDERISPQPSLGLGLLREGGSGGGGGAGGGSRDGGDVFMTSCVSMNSCEKMLIFYSCIQNRPNARLLHFYSSKLCTCGQLRVRCPVRGGHIIIIINNNNMDV